MKLSKILKNIKYTGKHDDREIANITYDSRKVKKNSMFIAISGENDDGHDYIDSDIFIINADGSRRVRITDTVEKIEMHPDWSPDGDQIVYNTYRDGIVYIISVK